MMWKPVLLAACTFGLIAGSAWAEPSLELEDNQFSVSEGFTDDMAARVKADMGKVDQNELEFYVENLKNEDLAKLCAACPGIKMLTIKNCKELTSIAPLAGLKSLRKLLAEIPSVKDLTPLAGLVNMEQMDIKGELVGPDLKWMSGMTRLKSLMIREAKALTSFEGIPAAKNLSSIVLTRAVPASLEPLLALSELTSLDLSYCTITDLSPLARFPKLNELSLYGAKLKDFSPLAGCAQLRKLTYYAVEGADFSTLGQLKQLQMLKGGLTKLDDISWLAGLPDLKKFDVFAEYVKDYSPLARTKVADFQIWNMHEAVDLKTLSGAVTLKNFKLWMQKDVVGFAGLAPLVNMENLIIDRVTGKDGPIDLSFIRNMKHLKTLQLNKCAVTNIEALASCTALEKLTMTEVSGVSSLKSLKKLAGLKTLTVSKGAFPAPELTGFAATVRITQR